MSLLESFRAHRISSRFPGGRCDSSHRIDLRPRRGLRFLVDLLWMVAPDPLDVMQNKLNMRYVTLLLLSLTMACTTTAKHRTEVVFNALPDLNHDRYKADPYIAMAQALQSIGKEAAVKKLLAYAQDERHDFNVIILCRMLFVAKPNNDFRRPGIGGAYFLGDTDYANWPLEPIELVDGVPFLITRGYLLGGRGESGKSYLYYCIENCEWNKENYELKSGLEKREALDKLLASPKWKHLPPDSFFSAQLW